MAEKKWKPPEGWQIERNDDSEVEGVKLTIRGTKTYPDGVERTLVAHSEKQFDELVALNEPNWAE